jgi:hypothetical protein
MSASDYYQVMPPLPLQGADLGLPAPPVAPPIPVQQPLTPQGPDHATSMHALLGAVAAALAGPQAGAGIAQGVVTGLQRRHQIQQQQIQQTRETNQQNEQNYLRQQGQYDVQDRAYQAEQDRRAQVYQQNITALRGLVEKGQLKKKDDYDRTVDAFANGLQQQGFRVDSNRLRQAAPFVAPSAEKDAQAAIELWRKNPVNENLLKTRPDEAAKAMIPFDLHGDGKPVNVSLHDMAVLGKMPFTEDEDGHIVFSEAGTSLRDRSNADGKLEQLIAQARADGKRLTPTLKGQLTDEARKWAREQDRLDALAKPKTDSDKLVKVEHKDPSTGKAVIEWLPQSQLAGRTFEKPTNATTQNRLDSAQAVQQTGNDIIAQLSDPAFAKNFGPVLGRATTVKDFIGNPPPEFSEIAGSIDSYALANMGVHGMRSTQGAEMIKKLLDGHHTPESLIAAIRGLNKFSAHFMANAGMTPSQPAPQTPNAAQSAKDKLNRR